MARSPEDRYPSASAMRAALAELRAHEGRPAASAELEELVAKVVAEHKESGRKRRPRPAADALIIPLSPAAARATPVPPPVPPRDADARPADSAARARSAPDPATLERTETDPLAGVRSGAGALERTETDPLAAVRPLFADDDQSVVTATDRTPSAVEDEAGEAAHSEEDATESTAPEIPSLVGPASSGRAKPESASTLKARGRAEPNDAPAEENTQEILEQEILDAHTLPPLRPGDGGRDDETEDELDDDEPTMQ
jgi:hypothetical protein